MQVTKRTPKNYIPMGSRMLCRRMTETMTSTVIHLTDQTKDRTLMFEVLAKGPDCVDDYIKVGMFIHTGQFAVCNLDFPGHPDWVSMNEDSVLGWTTEFEEETGEIADFTQPTRMDEEEDPALTKREKAR